MDVPQKVVLGVPHLGPLPGYFFDSVLSLKWPEGTRVLRVENKPVDIARNTIVRSFLEGSAADWLFFMDADMRFHPDTLARLLRSAHANGAKVLSGTYFARTDTPLPHVYRWTKEEAGVHWYQSMAREYVAWAKARPDRSQLPNAWCYADQSDDLVECDAVGGGCLLLHRAVLEAIGAPWFESNGTTGGGEDFDFCRRVQLAGYEVFANWAVQADHALTNVWSGHEEFMACFEVGSEREFAFDGPLPVTLLPSGQRVYSPETAVHFEERQEVLACDS